MVKQHSLQDVQPSFIRVGIDTGGTFTDFSCIDSSGRSKRWKTLSTPADPARAILEGVAKLLPDAPPDRIEIVHGTTVGTNAFLERKGARTLLITTAGFEDILRIGRQARPRLYALKQYPAVPIVADDMIVGIDERIGAKGDVLVPVNAKELAKIRQICMDKDAESIAVCLLHSYGNSLHERTVAKALADLKMPVSLSSEIMPEFREYERTSTTVINAYLWPTVGNYIKKLKRHLPNSTIYIQKSSGGCFPASNAGREAVQTLLSGPAAGVMAGLETGSKAGFSNVITFDMGGTSTDVSFCPGQVSYTRDYKIEGFPVSIPFIDIHTVGAGGGSIAWVDRGGLLATGPESAGADPGPACYGHGEMATVTDANLLLGRLRTDTFLDGRMKLWPERSEAAIGELARKLGMDMKETAIGIIKLVNTSLIQAIRAVSIEKGHDPRTAVLVCFGGAAGMHALEVAEELGIRNVIIPEDAGIFSASGMSGAEIAIERSCAFIKTVETVETEREIVHIFNRLEQELMTEAEISGLSHREIEFKRRIDARYLGQSFELGIPWTTKWKERLHSEHERLYGYALHNATPEVTALRITAVTGRPSFPVDTDSSKDLTSKDTCLPGNAEVTFMHGTSLVPVIPSRIISDVHFIDGPCLITDSFTTITVPEHWKAKASGRNIEFVFTGN